MLKNTGFSLLEMIIVLMLATLLLRNAIHILPSLHYTFFSQYHQEQIKRTLYQTLQPLAQHLRRVGFMCPGSEKFSQPSLFLSQNNRYIRLCTSSFLYSDQAQCENNQGLCNVQCIYRFEDNNISFLVKGEGAEGKKWRKLFDPKFITLHDFKIHDHDHYAEIMIIGSGVGFRSTTRHLLTFKVKYENR